MTRAEKVAQACELRGQGLLVREVAERMGVPVSTVGHWLSDSGLSKQRARRGAASVRCSRCDKKLSAAALLCRDCRSRDRHDRDCGVAELWAQGLTMPQIAAELRLPYGTVADSIVRMRKAGRDVSHRYQVSPLRDAPSAPPDILCVECGYEMIVESFDGRCGFCIQEERLFGKSQAA